MDRVRLIRGLQEDINTLATFGAEIGGVTRTAWSQPLMDACAWLSARFAACGLDSSIDAAGNVIGRWHGPSGKAVTIGSHIDTVPGGGRFDGALGVLGGLEAIRLLKAGGFEPRCPIWIVAFMDEEGARFGSPMFGSRAFVGRELGGLAPLRDRSEVQLGKAMKDVGFDFELIHQASAVDQVGYYLELHIEQGPVLEQEAMDIGVVATISGGAAVRAGFVGRGGHAGTTPMAARRDALVGAARAIQELRDHARSRADLRVTVGAVTVEPGAGNVIPATCNFSIDIRSPVDSTLNGALTWTRELLDRIAVEEGLEVELGSAHVLCPLQLDPEMRRLIAEAAAEERGMYCEINSGAGHDAMVLGRYVPTGMIFVPSRCGISHHPDEYTSPQHCELGARVLARAVAKLAA